MEFCQRGLLYQQAVKCKECNPNITVGLLCSCADAMKLGKTPNTRFKEFYERYCPQKLRKSPIEYYPNGALPLTPAPFDKALHYIYKQFRCLYVHEGIGRLRIAAPDEIEWNSLLDGIENEKDIYAVNITKIAEWLKQITFESLFAMLTKYPIPCLVF
jgi:hypothetical protein